MNKTRNWVFRSLCFLAIICHTAQSNPVLAQNTPSLSEISPLPDSAVLSQELPHNSELTPSDSAAISASVLTNSSDETKPSVPQNAWQDQPVFEKEELIDLTDRKLHPYLQKSFLSNTVQTAPWAYEQLKYGIYYSFIKAGTAYIRNRGLVDIDGRTAYLLQTSAFSAAVIDAFFKVRDINHSWLDAQEFYSLGYGQSVREGGYKRDEWLTFDYPQKRFFGEVQKKQEPRGISGPLEINVLDMLTSLYYVRSQPLEVGKDLVFDIINREKQYPLIVKVVKREKIKTAAGTFNTILVEPQIRGEGIFVSKGKNLKVWLTDDAYKMPVKMKVEVFIGSVSAELLEYKRQEATNIL